MNWKRKLSNKPRNIAPPHFNPNPHATTYPTCVWTWCICVQCVCNKPPNELKPWNELKHLSFLHVFIQTTALSQKPANRKTANNLSFFHSLTMSHSSRSSIFFNLPNLLHVSLWVLLVMTILIVIDSSGMWTKLVKYSEHFRVIWSLEKSIIWRLKQK